MFAKEVYLGTSAKDFSEIKVILDNNSIPYKTKVTSLDGSESSFFSSLEVAVEGQWVAQI